MAAFTDASVSYLGHWGKELTNNVGCLGLGKLGRSMLRRYKKETARTKQKEKAPGVKPGRYKGKAPASEGGRYEKRQSGDSSRAATGMEKRWRSQEHCTGKSACATKSS
jgi:hypothetical protein